MTKMWTTTYGPDGVRRVHVFPLNDTKSHELSVGCHCQPRVENVEKGVIVVHNSYDWREHDEQAATVECHGNA